MAIIKDIGVILREYQTGESNKRLVLLTDAHGKIVVHSRGARKAGSKLSANLFCCHEFIIFDGGSFLSLNQIAPMHSFAAVADDFDAYCAACSFLEIIDKVMMPSMESSVVLRLLLRALAELTAGRPPNMVFAVFMLKFLQKEGFVAADALPMLGAEAAEALNYILENDGKHAFAFNASKDVLDALCAAARTLIETNVDIQLKSLTLMEGL